MVLLEPLSEFGRRAKEARFQVSRNRFSRSGNPRKALEAIHGSVQFIERDELPVGVRHENGSGAEEERCAPTVEERHVGREREDMGLETRDGVHSNWAHPEHLRDLDARLQSTENRQDVVGRPDRPEHHLSRCVGGNHIRRDATLDQANAIEG